MYTFDNIVEVYGTIHMRKYSKIRSLNQKNHKCNNVLSFNTPAN